MTYHYTMCGLDYVYLRSGYREHQTPYGMGVSIMRADSLNRQIGRRIILSRARLRGQEVRYLRSLAKLSQTELANLLGVKRITVARWEGAPNAAIPGPSDRSVRFIAASIAFDTRMLGVLGNVIAEISDERPQKLTMRYLPDEADAELPLLNKQTESGVEDGWEPEKKVA